MLQTTKNASSIFDSDDMSRWRSRRLEKLRKKYPAHVARAIKRTAHRNKVLRNVGHKIIGVTVLLPLRPFKPMMERALSKKGISTKGLDFVKLVELFYNEFVSKKNNPSSKYAEIPDNYLIDNSLMKKTYDNYDEETDSFALSALGGIVTAIIHFFKLKKEQKIKAIKEGIKLKVNDEAFGLGTIKIESDLKKKQLDDVPVRHKEIKKTLFIAIGLVVLIAGGFLILKK